MTMPPERTKPSAVRPARKRTRTSKMPEGRPFPPKTSGNPRGRPVKKPVSPTEALMKPLMTPIVITVAGKKRRVPRLEAMSELFGQQILQKDQGATRALASLIRAVTGLVAASKLDAAGRKAPPKNTKALAKILKAHERRVREGALRNKNPGGDDLS